MRLGMALLATFVCTMEVSSASIDSRATPDAQSPPGSFVQVGDHRLHLDCRGHGSPAVIFDSGLGSSSLDWVRVQPDVARVTRACVYDRAGYGWSDPGPN